MAIKIIKTGNTLEQFSNSIGKDIIVQKRMRKGEEVWQATIKETKVTKLNSGVFEDDYIGFGENSNEAILNYTKLISGKQLVYKDFTSESERWNVPILDY